MPATNRIACVICSLTVLCAAGAAADGLNLLGRWEAGACRAIAVEGNLACIGNGANLSVVDCTNPEVWVERDRLAVPRPPEVIATRGGLVLVAAEGTATLVVDASDPTELVVVSALPHDDVADLVFAGPIACISTVWGLDLVDLTDPAAPVEVGSIEDYGAGRLLAVNADATLLFRAGPGAALDVVDISDPTQPTVLGSYDYPYAAHYHDIAFCGPGHVVVAAGWQGLHVYDVSDPAAPVLAAEIDNGVERIDTVAVHGGIMHLARAHADGLFLDLYDLSDPLQPMLIGSAASSTAASQIVATADRSYFAGGQLGLNIFDVSDPADPHEAGRFDTVGELLNVAVTGDLALATAGVGGVQLLDVSDPRTPFRVGRLDLGASAWDVAARGDHAYVTAEVFYVLDISDPAAPSVVGQCSPTAFGNIVLEGDLAYIVGGWHGLSIIDISDPAQPEEIGEYDYGFDVSVTDVAVSGGLAYLTWAPSGPEFLQIVDVSDPTEPVLLATVSSFGARQVEIRDGYLFAGGYAGLQVYDLADPLAPAMVADIAAPYFSAFSVEGDRGYAGAVFEGVAVFDLADPLNPSLVTTRDLGGAADGLAISGSILFAAVPENGLWTLQDEAAVGVDDDRLPAPSRLLDAYPNPFNPRTTVAFTVEYAQPVTLSVHDLSGRLVATLHSGICQPGRHEVSWQGRDGSGRAVPSGTYLLRLKAAAGTVGRKISLVR